MIIPKSAIMERFCFLVFLCAIFVTRGYCTGSIFQPLSDHISPKLRPYIVPQTDPAKPVTVGVQVGVFAVDGVDRRRNELHIRSWLMVTWNSTITWNPADFNGLGTIRLPAVNGYVPQVASLASAGFHEILTPLETRYVFNGIAVFFVTVRWKLLCDMSKEDTCAIKMYSSDYDNSVVRLRHPKNLPIDMNKVTAGLRFEKSEYEIFSESHSHGEETVEGIRGGHDWVQYQFSFKKRRRDSHNGYMAVFKWD